MTEVYFLNPHTPPTLPPHILTIGNFDGVHLGHQAMLATLKRTATAQNLSAIALIFEPQPKEFFDPANAPARLSTLDEKLAKLHGLVDCVLVATFDKDFCTLSAHAFCQMLRHLGTQGVVVGDDFRFGQDRQGDQSFLKNQGFEIYSLDSVLLDGVRVSSTIVRKALSQGDLPTAKALLGTDYAITGQVVHGDKIGRTLDFPTANVALNRNKPALTGVFGADIIAYKDGQIFDLYDYYVEGIKGTRPHSLFGAVNVGTRPSVGGTQWRLEVHLPDFMGDLYDLTLQVVFCHYLHSEQKYENLSQLKAGIANDVQALLKWRHIQGD